MVFRLDSAENKAAPGRLEINTGSTMSLTSAKPETPQLI